MNHPMLRQGTLNSMPLPHRLGLGIYELTWTHAQYRVHRTERMIGVYGGMM